MGNLIRVRAIMGKNFWGVEEWKKFYNVEFSKEELRKLAEFPWSKNILNAPCPFHKGKSIKETHFAFLGLNCIRGKPLNIMEWHILHPESGQPRFCSWPGPDTRYDDAWYAKEKFANERTCGFRWYLMLLEIVPGSKKKIFEEKVAMLPAKYKVPWTIEEVTKLFLYYKKNGTYLNPSNTARCQDIDSEKNYVYVGNFDKNGLEINSAWLEDHDHPGFNVGIVAGLTASRKF